MNISLDWDGTVTSDYDSWLLFVKLMRAAGHKVYIVTMRYPSEIDSDPYMEKFKDHVNDIIATSRQAKKPYCDKNDIDINVWIDDNPLAVHADASAIWGKVSEEGNVVIPVYNAEQNGTPVEKKTFSFKELADKDDLKTITINDVVVMEYNDYNYPEHILFNLYNDEHHYVKRELLKNIDLDKQPHIVENSDGEEVKFAFYQENLLTSSNVG